MKNTEKGFIGILAVIVIVLVVGIYGGTIKNKLFPSKAAEPNKPVNTNPAVNNTTAVNNEPNEVLNCTNPPAANPTAAYTFLFDAVKKKDSLAIKCQMSKSTIEFAKFSAQTYKKTLDKAVENGMSESFMQPRLPEITNSKINGSQATIDVKKADGKWEQIPFVKEDGNWKLAFGEVMQGKMSITQPGATNPTLDTKGPNMIKGNPTTDSQGKPAPLSQPNQKEQKKPGN